MAVSSVMFTALTVSIAFFLTFGPYLTNSKDALNDTIEFNGNDSGSGEETAETAKHEEEDKCRKHHEEGEFDSSVRIARFEFERVETIFIILVFIMVVVLAKMGEYWLKWVRRPSSWLSRGTNYGVRDPVSQQCLSMITMELGSVLNFWVLLCVNFLTPNYYTQHHAITTIWC